MLSKSPLTQIMLILPALLWASEMHVQKVWGSPQDSSQSSKIEIDRIDLLGVQVFSTREIEGALEVSPGDRLERLKVMRTAENIQFLYVSRGYENVRVQSRLVRKKEKAQKAETVLEIEVVEGKPTRVHSVKVIPEGPMGGFWQRHQKKVQSSIAIHTGDVLNQDRVLEAKRAIQEVLAAEGYIGTKVDEDRMNSPLPPVHAASQESKENEGRWVTLEFRVNVGEKVKFGFRGNTFFTRGYLDGLVDDLRVVGLGKDFMRVIKSRIEEEYRSSGFARVEVNSFSIEGSEKEDRKVTFLIQEGPRVKIDSIDFDGNYAYTAEKLRNELLSRASSLIQNNIYVEKDFQKAAELLIEKMKGNGYLSAKVITTNVFYVPKPRTQQANSSVRLLVYLYEGDQTVAHDFTFSGVTLLSQDEVKKILNVQEGLPLNLYALADGLENLKREYRNQGYLAFKILNEGVTEGAQSLVRYQQENRMAHIQIQVEEGPQYTVSRVEIEGLEKTKESVVHRELEFKEGGVLTELQLSESERNLRRLGIFSTVTLRTSDDSEKENAKIVKVVVHEADRGVLTWGPGLRNDLGVRLFGQLAYTNLWGRGHTAWVTLNMNRRFYLYNFAEAQAQVAYEWPWFIWPELTFRPALSAGRTQYFRFATDTITGSTTWEKPLAQHPNLVGSFAYTIERVNQFNVLEARDKDQFLIGSVSPKLKMDLRDSPLAPTKGLYTVAWLDFSDSSLGSRSDIGFYRAQFRTDYHLPIFKDVIFYMSFRTGYEKNTAKEAGSQIPLIKQFALGGIGSLRGYQEQELNKQGPEDPRITDSLSYVNYRTQLDLPLSGALKFGLFLDAANLLVDRYSFGALTYGTGGGFHYQTPVGPVNLDLGFKLNPAPNKDPYVIHFSVGVI